MATSTKVQFKLETLKQKALESIDRRIGLKQAELEGYGNAETRKAEIAEWRARQEARISELFRSLDEIDSVQLAQFKLEGMPRDHTFEQERAAKAIVTLQEQRTTIEAKADSLVPDAEGNISLTKTQLQEFFAL